MSCSGLGREVDSLRDDETEIWLVATESETFVLDLDRRRVHKRPDPSKQAADPHVEEMVLLLRCTVGGAGHWVTCRPGHLNIRDSTQTGMILRICRLTGFDADLCLGSGPAANGSCRVPSDGPTKSTPGRLSSLDVARDVESKSRALNRRLGAGDSGDPRS